MSAPSRDAGAGLSAELEAKLLARLAAEWEAINFTFFRGALRRPVFRLSDTRERLGQWNGVPMAFLVREVLESADDLDEAIAVFRDSPRTCEYYFVIADGKTNRAVGMEAGASKFSLVEPNASHPLLPRPVKDAVLLSAGASPCWSMAIRSPSFARVSRLPTSWPTNGTT